MLARPVNLNGFEGVVDSEEYFRSSICNGFCQNEMCEYVLELYFTCRNTNTLLGWCYVHGWIALNIKADKQRGNRVL